MYSKNGCCLNLSLCAQLQKYNIRHIDKLYSWCWWLYIRNITNTNIEMIPKNVRLQKQSISPLYYMVCIKGYWTCSCCTWILLCTYIHYTFIVKLPLNIYFLFTLILYAYTLCDAPNRIITQHFPYNIKSKLVLGCGGRNFWYNVFVHTYVLHCIAYIQHLYECEHIHYTYLLDIYVEMYV